MFSNKVINQAIQRFVNSDANYLAIYPYGRNGKLLGKILNGRFNLEAKYIIDNSLCNSDRNIISVNDFKNLYSDDICIALTVEDKSINSAMEENLKNFISPTRIINLLSVEEERKNIETALDGVKKFVTNGYTLEDEFEKRWKKIKNEYSVIKIYKCTVDAIGELLSRYFAFDEEKKEGELSVLIPTTQAERNKIVNTYAYQYIGMPDIDEVIFWLYIIKEHAEEVDLSDMERYMKRQNLDIFFKRANSVQSHYSLEDINKGEMNLLEEGIVRKFVCMAARNPQYNKRTMSGVWDESIYDYRNFQFEDYIDAIDYLNTINVQVVKVGRYEEPINSIENCIDYAGRHPSDFMDLFIMSKCEFLITGSTGIFAIAQLFTKPVLMVNMIPISFGFGGCRYTEYDMFIMKKLYDQQNNKYLSLREISELEMNCRIDGDFYKKNDIQVEDNSPEEILNATKEMIDRLQGIWVDTEEDKKNYIKYQTIYKEINKKQINNPRNWLGGSVPYRLATTFIRENLYLLE